MSQGRPQLPGRGAVLYGVGPFLRRRSAPGTDAVNTSTPAGSSGSSAARPISSSESHTTASSAQPSGHRLAPPPTSGLTPQSPRQNCRLPEENPDKCMIDTKGIFAGQVDAYRRVAENVQLLQSFAAELSNGVDEADTQDHVGPAGPSQPTNPNTANFLFNPRTSTTRARRVRQQSSAPRETSYGWGVHKDFDDCSRSEQRKRLSALRHIAAYWELDSSTNDILSVLEELRPTEALVDHGKGAHEKPTIDEYFARQFYEKDDRDCSSVYLGLLARYSELFCGDRRSHGLDILRYHANIRQMPDSDHPLWDIMELIRDDISRALDQPCLEKILIHPSQRLAMRLQNIRDDVAIIEQEGIEAMMAEQRTHKDSRKLESMMRLQQKKLARLVQSLSNQLSVQMQRLPPREAATLQDPREISIDMSFCRPGQPLSYKVEFPGEEFTYNGIMQGNLAPNLRPTCLKVELSQLKKRCKNQQRTVDNHMRQIHQRAMACVGGRLINKKAHTRAINDYVHTHAKEARRLHRALLKSARLKASVQMVNFHLRAHSMSFLHEVKR
ncbi:uncharacterized protein J3D65DRAFT_629227 [Phyllosticta citribraziliensis]|uniref:Uncharacterized protein n=1 Tax=Phyllosticta citribraziliensis TaxID=989973 RepID=A0ABR1LI29_9PEZI